MQLTGHPKLPFDQIGLWCLINCYQRCSVRWHSGAHLQSAALPPSVLGCLLLCFPLLKGGKEEATHSGVQPLQLSKELSVLEAPGSHSVSRHSSPLIIREVLGCSKVATVGVWHSVPLIIRGILGHCKVATVQDSSDYWRSQALLETLKGCSAPPCSSPRFPRYLKEPSAACSTAKSSSFTILQAGLGSSNSLSNLTQLQPCSGPRFL